MEIGLDPNGWYVFVVLFDPDGLVVKRSSDEWQQADLADLLQGEIGLPDHESQSLAAKFIASATDEGHEQAPPAKTPFLANLALNGFAVAILVLVIVGLWTIGSWIF